MTGARGPAVGLAIETFAQVAKVEIERWSDYAVQVATNLDAPGGYKGDAATADLAAAISHAIESGTNLTLGAIDALLVLAGDLDDPYSPPSDEYSTKLKGAKLRLKGALRSLSHTLPPDAVVIKPEQLGAGKTKFRLRVIDATGYEPGYYEGTVEASTADGLTEDVPVEISLA